jgi:hypothetical protein
VTKPKEQKLQHQPQAQHPKPPDDYSDATTMLLAFDNVGVGAFYDVLFKGELKEMHVGSPCKSEVQRKRTDWVITGIALVFMSVCVDFGYFILTFHAYRMQEQRGSP